MVLVNTLFIHYINIFRIYSYEFRHNFSVCNLRFSALAYLNKYNMNIYIHVLIDTFKICVKSFAHTWIPLSCFINICLKTRTKQIESKKKKINLFHI